MAKFGYFALGALGGSVATYLTRSRQASHVSPFKSFMRDLMDIAEEAVDRADVVVEKAEKGMERIDRMVDGQGSSTATQSTSIVSTPWGKTTTVTRKDGTSIVVKDG